MNVSTDNFIRAESDLYFGHIVADGSIGRFTHNRELTPLDRQLVIRQNRDTLYSAAVFDLDAGPVTITMPDAGPRFMSAQVITEDHYVPEVTYGRARLALDRDAIGTRYAVVAVRTLVNPNDPADIEAVHALQDQITVEQTSVGIFETPAWDPGSQKAVRDALTALAALLPDTRGMFGTGESTDPVRHLIGSASAWGGNPESDALYLNVVPERNDGTTVHRMTVRDVPVDGFWSVTVYDADGYFQPNPQNAYSINDVTAHASPDGTVDVQFGGCDGQTPNCLPITPGWNYMVRLYRPRAEILNGEWTFPVASPVDASPGDVELDVNRGGA
jgi:hypothetical protein